MPVHESPTRYVTSDGMEYADAVQAERHEGLVEANKAYADAAQHLGRLLAETQKTADGYPFEWGRLAPYYYVSPGWNQMPALSKVSFYVWGCSFDRDDALKIHQREGEQTREYRINELYYTERAAERALLVAQEAWVAERLAEVEKLRQRLQGGR